MKKFLIPYLFGAATAALVFALISTVGGGSAASAEATRHGRSNPTRLSPSEGETDHRRRSPQPSAPPSTSPAAETLRLMEQLALLNPDLLARLNLYLFDWAEEPNLESWALLGLGKNDAEDLHQRLKPVLDDIRKLELQSHKVISQDENSVTLALPPLPTGQASELVGKIEKEFSGTFTPALAKLLAQDFLKEHSMTCAGLQNRLRFITVARTSEEIFKETGRQFTMEGRTMHEGATIDRVIDNLDRYSQIRSGQVLLPSIPTGWEHLFKTVK